METQYDLECCEDLGCPTFLECKKAGKLCQWFLDNVRNGDKNLTQCETYKRLDWQRLSREIGRWYNQPTWP